MVESPEPVKVVVSGDLVAELRVLHPAGRLRALEAEAVLLRQRPRGLLLPRYGGPRRVVPLPRRALAPRARHR
jgi:hypothetical protein